MTTSELKTRVTRDGIVTLGGLAIGVGALAGVPSAAGLVLGGTLALFSFHCLAGFAEALGAPRGGSPLRRALGGPLRHVTALAALGAAVAGGWVHPVGVAAGIAVLPVVLLVEGLRS